MKKIRNLQKIYHYYHYYYYYYQYYSAVENCRVGLPPRFKQALRAAVQGYKSNFTFLGAEGTQIITILYYNPLDKKVWISS